MWYCLVPLLPVFAAARSPLLVRWALLDPQGSGSLQKEALPMLRSSLCLAEQHLKPALEAVHAEPPRYVVYTDSHSHGATVSMVQHAFPELLVRLDLINLDTDPGDEVRTGELIRSLGLDAVNTASLRRTLADSDHLPPEHGRLLLGSDTAFLSDATELVLRMSNLSSGQALYMADLVTFERPYIITGYSDVQCPGLMADFVYLTPGLEVKAQSIREKAVWFSQQPISIDRTDPPTFHLAWSNGLHAIDQFALNLAVAEAVTPQGSVGCIPLPEDIFFHRGGYSRDAVLSGVEAMHDKVISSCGHDPWDSCGKPFQVALLQEEEGDQTPNLYGAPAGTHVCGQLASLDDVYHLPFLILAGTLCLTEHQLSTPLGVSGDLLAWPTYKVFANDRTCGQASSLLHHNFPTLKTRLKLINLSRMPFWSSEALRPGVAGCAAMRHRADPFIGLQVTFPSSPATVSQLLRSLNQSQRYLHLMDVVHTQPPRMSGPLQGWVDMTVFFCLCGQNLEFQGVKLACPEDPPIA